MTTSIICGTTDASRAPGGPTHVGTAAAGGAIATTATATRLIAGWWR